MGKRDRKLNWICWIGFLIGLPGVLIILRHGLSMDLICMLPENCLYAEKIARLTTYVDIAVLLGAVAYLYLKKRRPNSVAQYAFLIGVIGYGFSTMSALLPFTNEENPIQSIALLSPVMNIILVVAWLLFFRRSFFTDKV